jgi:PAS domain S-box-containing protein
VLLVEGHPDEAEVLVRSMRAIGRPIEHRTVDTEGELIAALRREHVDVVVTDRGVPQMLPPRTIDLARMTGYEGPIIVVSGTMDEEMVVEALRAGADDFVLKANLRRLVPAIERSLREGGIRAAARRAEAALSLSEARYESLVRSIPAAVYVDEALDKSSALYRTRFLGPQIEGMLGYPPSAFEQDPDLWWRLVHPEDRDRVFAADRDHYATGESTQQAFRMVARDGRIVWILDQATIVNPDGPGPRISQGILTDFTERKRREEEIHRIKTELVQVLAHELFTPITTIQGTAATMSVGEGRLSREELRELAAGVDRAATRLRRLVANIGTVAALERETVPPPSGSITVRSIIQRSIEGFARDLADRVVVRASDDVVDLSVRAQVDLGPRALVIVIENALDLGGGSRVEIDAVDAGDEIRIEVSDRGPGIPPDQRDRIFELFTQAEPVVTRSHEGLGIGLFLARRIMETHGGRLHLRDREGGGSTFVLTFPAAVADRPSP